MMRRVGGIAVVLASVMVASANVQINWDTSNDGAGRIYRVMGDITTANRLPSTSLAQLLGSVNSVVSALPTSMTPAEFMAMQVLGAVPPSGVDDFSLYAATMNDQSLNGRVSWVVTLANSTGGHNLVGAYVFSRVFDISYGVTPAVGSTVFYVESATAGPLGDVNASPPGTPTDLDPTPGGANIFTGTSTTEQGVKYIQIIPEPTSALYLLVAAGALVVRRIRRRN